MEIKLLITQIKNNTDYRYKELFIKSEKKLTVTK